MQFTLDPDQRQLIDATTALFARHAGPARARLLGGDHPAYDRDLHQALADAGFLDCAGSPGAGPLEAALVIEAAASAAAVVSVGASGLVAPMLGVAPAQGPLALTVDGHQGPVRFAGDAEAVLVAGEDRARLVSIPVGAAQPVDSRFGIPMGRLSMEVLNGPAETLPDGSAARLRSWWRVALAAELAGTMRAALDQTVAHVRDRRQFGRPIGSFQALQHRLAETAILVDGSRWLMLEAAWLGAPARQSATAVTHAVVAARRVFREAHQLTGAIGLTRGHDLHLWTLRLPALVIETQWMAATPSGHPTSLGYLTRAR